MNEITYGNISAARRRAEQEIEMADCAIRQAADLIRGRLKVAGVQCWVLEDLKKELKNYNMHTGEWK